MSWKRPWKEIRDIEERLYPEFLDNIDIKLDALEFDDLYYLMCKLDEKYTDKFKEQFNIHNEYEDDETTVLSDFIEEDEFIAYLRKRYPEIKIYEVSYIEYNFKG